MVPGQSFDLLGFVWWSLADRVAPPSSHAVAEDVHPPRQVATTTGSFCRLRWDRASLWENLRLTGFLSCLKHDVLGGLR